MTDGTSQGLFIVVAIVIFGIFVVLAYILFEDTLSPAMASMFHTAIEKTTKSLNQVKNKQLLDMAKTYRKAGTIEKKSSKEVVLYSDGIKWAGISFPLADIIEEGKTYELSYNMKLDMGTITHIGGHLGGHDYGSGAKNVELYLNDQRVRYDNPENSQNDSYNGVKIPFAYNVGDTIHVRIRFDVDSLSVHDFDDKALGIEPNRTLNDGFTFGKEYRATFTNLSLTEFY